MARLDLLDSRPPSKSLNLACLAAPTLAFFLEVWLYERMHTVHYSMYQYFGHFLLAQYALGFILAVVLAYRAPTWRLRSAAKWYLFGTLLLPVIIIGAFMYVVSTGAFD